jgi:hypothetical protein
VPVYLVERILRGATIEILENLRDRTEDACRSAAGQGRPVRYLRSTFAPGESRCHCLFEAPDSDIVREVNDAAGFPYERIMLAVQLGAGASAEHQDPTQLKGTPSCDVF